MEYIQLANCERASTMSSRFAAALVKVVSHCLYKQLIAIYIHFCSENVDVEKIRKAIKAVKRRGDIKKRKFNESIDLQFVLKRHNWRNEEPIRGTIRLVLHEHAVYIVEVYLCIHHFHSLPRLSCRLKHAPNIVKFGMKKVSWHLACSLHT